MFLLILERDEWREREREKHQSVASCTCPDQGANPEPRYMPLPGMEPTMCLVPGTMLQPTELHEYCRQLSQLLIPSSPHFLIFKRKKLY